jgi:hypothetical protein
MTERPVWKRSTIWQMFINRPSDKNHSLSVPRLFILFDNVYQLAQAVQIIEIDWLHFEMLLWIGAIVVHCAPWWQEKVLFKHHCRGLQDTSKNLQTQENCKHFCFQSNFCDSSGIPGDLFYVKDGTINEYALTFNLPIKSHVDEIYFNWQNLRSNMPVSKLLF